MKPIPALGQAEDALARKPFPVKTGFSTPWHASLLHGSESSRQVFASREAAHQQGMEGMFHVFGFTEKVSLKEGGRNQI